MNDDSIGPDDRLGSNRPGPKKARISDVCSNRWNFPCYVAGRIDAEADAQNQQHACDAPGGCSPRVADFGRALLRRCGRPRGTGSPQIVTLVARQLLSNSLV